MEMDFDGGGLDVTEIRITIFGVGSVVDVGSCLMPICATGGFDFGRVILLTPNVSATRAGFLQINEINIK